MRPFIPLFFGFVLAVVSLSATAGAESIVLETFEKPGAATDWSFSSGPEFPGGKGKFEPAKTAAHQGEFGGALHFDFSGGGNYVAAAFRLPTVSNDWNGLRLWLKRPEGNEVVLRYTDATGQTFQKPVDCSAGQWTQVTVPFTEWTGHWGGANDGRVRGRPVMLALLAERGLQTTGTLLFDDLQLVRLENATAHVSYPAYRFEPDEAWYLRSEGNRGASKLEGKTWTADFSQGARWVSLGVPDHVLLGSVERLRLRVRGNAHGHPVRLILRTHFMTFHKVIGEFTGEGEQELVTDGPPGPGWQWYGGENDGKIHGPLRLAEIGLGAGTNTSPCTLELRELVVDASCPSEKRCILLAESDRSQTEPEFIARARGLTSTPLAGTLHWVLADWEGREHRRGSVALSVPPLGQTAEVKVPVTQADAAGRKFLELQCRLEIPGQEIAPVHATWVQPGQFQGDSRLEPESPFGMGVYLNRYGGDPAGLALMERAATLARDAGVKWSREDFSWGRIEPNRGQFDWSYYDQLVACARRNGITVYAIVGYWTRWTRPYTSEGVDDYVEFVRALVRRYQKDIKQWEIWNEPNIFFWDGPKDLYAELLTKSYAAIKQLDPTAEVLGISTAGIDNKFIARMMELKAPFDILTIHPYRTQLNDEAFIADLKKVSDQVKLPNGQRRPVWLTEMGWATHTPHNTLRQDFAPNTLRAQAELIARSYLCAIVSGVDPRTFWYNFRNDGTDPIYFEHQMGILYNDFTPKPAYVAYATLTRVLKGKHVVGPIPTPPGILAFNFKPVAGPGETIAVWSPQKDAVIQIPSTAPELIRVNGIGEESILKSENGQLTVELRRGAPVYLISR